MSSKCLLTVPSRQPPRPSNCPPDCRRSGCPSCSQTNATPGRQMSGPWHSAICHRAHLVLRLCLRPTSLRVTWHRTASLPGLSSQSWGGAVQLQSTRRVCRRARRPCNGRDGARIVYLTSDVNMTRKEGGDYLLMNQIFGPKQRRPPPTPTRGNPHRLSSGVQTKRRSPPLGSGGTMATPSKSMLLVSRSPTALPLTLTLPPAHKLFDRCWAHIHLRS